MKAKKSIYAGIGVVAVVAIIIVIYFTQHAQQTQKIEVLGLDFTYDEANSNMKDALQSQGISMSSPLKFSDQKDVEKYCNFFTDQDKQKLVQYCTSTEIKDAEGNFLGNIHMVGSSKSPGLVMAVLQSNPLLDNLSQIKTVFGTMSKELVCDCWEQSKPGGYETIDIWIDALRDFHTTGDKPHSKSKPLELASKHLQIELTTNKDGYLWNLLIAR